MSDDLVKRLRQVGGVKHDGATRWYVNQDGPEAADRIEKLEDAIFHYVTAVVQYEGVTFIDEQTEEWQKLILSVWDARAALAKEKKDG